MLNGVCFVVRPTCHPFVPSIFVFSLLLSYVLIVVINYNKIGGQFNERLLLWQPSGIFLYSTVIILICFMLCWRIKYDDDDDDDDALELNYF